MISAPVPGGDIAAAHRVQGDREGFDERPGGEGEVDMAHEGKAQKKPIVMPQTVRWRNR
ncbi:hypothetical protein SANTM175S_00273 [Streptomyces antimycoticus]